MHWLQIVKVSAPAYIFIWIYSLSRLKISQELSGTSDVSSGCLPPINILGLENALCTDLKKKLYLI